MSKVTTPLLSLAAKGSLANAITYTRRRGTNIVEKKPIPRNPQSLAQTYQRWDYQDGIFYWHTLSSIEQKEWKSAARRYHMPGFSYFMRWYLNNLPDLAGRWHLDIISEAITPDSSRNLHHGAVIGATVIKGVIDNGFLFDGLDDGINCGATPDLDISGTQLYIGAFITLHDLTINPKIASTRQNWNSLTGYSFGHYEDDLWFRFGDGANYHSFSALNVFTQDRTYHVAITYNGTHIKLYVDGYEVKSTPEVRLIASSGLPFRIGRYGNPGSFLDGSLDEVEVRNRPLEADQILNHSQRRYPL